MVGFARSLWGAAAGLGLSLFLAGAAPAQDAVRHTLTLVNDSPVRLQEFWLATTAGEGEDVLGAEVVAAGERKTLNLYADACLYDFQAVFADGRRAQQFNYDVCAGPELRMAALLRDHLLAEPSGGGAGSPDATANAAAAPEPYEPAVSAPPPPPPAPGAAVPARAGSAGPARGVPICPGDARCKRR